MLDHNRRATTKDYVRGFYVLKNASDSFESTYTDDCDKFFDKLTKSLK